MISVRSARIVIVALASVLFFGNLVMPANAVGTATPLYLSFETEDALGAEVAKPSAPGHLLGSWYDGAVTAIAPSPPATHEGQALSFLKAQSAYAWSGFTAFDGGASTIYTNTANPSITMDYYSPSSSNTPLELKLEVVGNKTKDAFKVLSAAPGWNSLTFDMSTGAKNWNGSAGYNRMSLIPNFGGDQAIQGLSAASNNGQKYYIDNISVNGGTLANVQTGGPAPAPSPTASANKIFLSYETNDGNGANSISTDAGLGTFNPAGAVEIANVPTSGGHSGKGAKFTKSKDGAAYSGYKLIYGADTFRYTNADNKTISFDYYASVASPVQVKLETANGDQVILTKSASTGWNALSFDMSTAIGWSDNVAFNLVAVFPDFSDNADFTSAIVTPNDQLFYIDNVSINGGTLNDVGTQPTPSSSPTATATATPPTGVTCTEGTPTIRLLAPNSDLNGTPTGYSGVWQYLDPGTVVFSHYFPLRSTVAIKYQALDSTCQPVAAGTKVFLAVNANYSRAKTVFQNTYLGALNVIQPIAPECAADQYCGDGQTVLEQSADSSGQVTFVLTNLNATSPEGKPQSPLSLPSGTMLLQSVFSPSFSNYHVDPFTGIATGAGAANIGNHEAIDVLWPNFANGLGDVAQPADAIVTPNTTKSLRYTLRTPDGGVLANKSVTVTTDDGGILVSPSSAGADADSNGFTTVNATTNAQGEITVVAKSTKRSIQTIRVTAGVMNADPAITEINGYNTLTWGVAQTIAAVKPTSVNRGKSIVLPAKTSKSQAISWSSSTKAICKIVTSKGAASLTTLKKGACKITGTNRGNSTLLPVTKSVTVTVK